MKLWRSHEQFPHRALAAQSQPTPMDVGAMGKGTSSTGGKVVANVTIRRSKHVRDVVTRITLQQTVLTLTNRAENVERLVIRRVHVDLLDRRSPIRRVVARRAREARVQVRPKRVGLVARPDTYRPSAPKKNVHTVEKSATASQVGCQETTMIGVIGSYFDLGSVSEGTSGLRCAREEICSVGANECARR